MEATGPAELLTYTVASGTFYLPLERATADGLAVYRPAGVPPTWEASNQGVWRLWMPPQRGRPLPDAGWKVHVSAQLDRAQQVLDTVARVCVEEGIGFKHLATELYFVVLHSKHAPRADAGKFCTAYPPGVAAARRLMARLAHELDGETGPYILTDRRYGESGVVSYRYGAYRPRFQVRADGTRVALVADGRGALVPDVRGVSFRLPACISDPFQEPVTPPEPGPIVIGGYEVHQLVRHSNAGGSYLGADRSSGRQVFIKEARACTGLAGDRTDAVTRLRREHRVLRDLHRRVPGICPEPLDLFREWENEFLVCELVPGVPLSQWISRFTPTTSRRDDPAECASYYARCIRILADLAGALRAVHHAGYRFGDVSPDNVIVGDDEQIRLVDFEAANRIDEPVSPIGTPGFAEPASLAQLAPTTRDEYGLRGVARAMLFQFHETLARSPRNLALLRRDVAATTPVPDALWQAAGRFRERTTESRHAVLPAPAELDERPAESVAAIVDGLAAAILASASFAGAGPVFPTVPHGYRTNLHNVAYGTAGVLHVLHTCGYEIPAGIRERFRQDCLAARDQLPPGLLVGSAGLACVLAELGMLDEASQLHKHAAAIAPDHLPPSLGTGTAGVAYSCLWMYQHTGDQGYLDRAIQLAESLLATVGRSRSDSLTAGLLHGWAGLAWSLQVVGQVVDSRYREVGRDCLRHALDEATERPGPDLAAGTAGLLRAAARYRGGDEPVEACWPAMVRDVSRAWTGQAGLFNGLAGLVWTAADLACAEPAAMIDDDPVRVATRLAKYAVPAPTGGFGILGEGNQRLSCDLATGSAGVLLAMGTALHGRPDPLLGKPLGLAP